MNFMDISVFGVRMTDCGSAILPGQPRWRMTRPGPVVGRPPCRRRGSAPRSARGRRSRPSRSGPRCPGARRAAPASASIIRGHEGLALAHRDEVGEGRQRLRVQEHGRAAEDHEGIARAAVRRAQRDPGQAAASSGRGGSRSRRRRRRRGRGTGRSGVAALDGGERVPRALQVLAVHVVGEEGPLAQHVRHARSASGRRCGSRGSTSRRNRGSGSRARRGSCPACLMSWRGTSASQVTAVAFLQLAGHGQQTILARFAPGLDHLARRMGRGDGGPESYDWRPWAGGPERSPRLEPERAGPRRRRPRPTAASGGSGPPP